MLVNTGKQQKENIVVDYILMTGAEITSKIITSTKNYKYKLVRNEISLFLLKLKRMHLMTGILKQTKKYILVCLCCGYICTIK